MSGWRLCLWGLVLAAACGRERAPGSRDPTSTADEDASPGDGALPVDVEPPLGPPSLAETLLALPVVEAGAPIVVRCAAYDAGGREVRDARATAIDAPSELTVEAQLTDGFRLRATELGEYDLACRFGDLVDPSPARVSVVVGVPRHSETSVAPAIVQPGEPVVVTCVITDASGNVRDDVDVSVAALPASESASTEGLVLAGGVFSATRAGEYDVFCAASGFDAGDESPARVTVLPGDACSWVVDPVAEDCYAQGRRVPVDVVVLDCFGNRIEAPSLLLASTPSGAVWAQTGGIVFPDEAVYDVELTYAGEQDAGSTIGPWLDTFVVDSTPPRWSIGAPARAAMLQEGAVGSSTVSIAGAVSDPVSPIVAITLNGATLAPSGAALVEPIAATQTSEWGLSVITGSAADACGNRAVLVQSYLRSPSYFAASTAPDAAARVPQGVLAQLNQPAIDDWDRGDVDELATLGQTALGALDLNADIPPGYVLAYDPLRSADECRWSFPCGDTWFDQAYTVARHPDGGRRITIEGPFVYGLVAVNGGLWFDVVIRNFSLPLRVEATERTCACGAEVDVPISASGSIAASQAHATGVLGVSLLGGAPDVTVADLSLTTEGLTLTVDCGLLQILCDGITALIVYAAEDAIENALADTVREQLPPLVEEFITGFSLDASFSTPAPLAATVSVSSGLDRLYACGATSALAKPSTCPLFASDDGFLSLGLGTQFFPSERGAAVPAEARGSIRKDGTLASFSRTSYAFGVGLKDDLLNQLLWSLWYAGALEVPDLAALSESLGVPGVSLSFSAGLPPVVMPGGGGYPSRIGLGDAYIDATVDLAQVLGGAATGAPPLHIALYLSTIVGASIDLDPATNELLIALDPTPEVYVQVAAIDDPRYQAAMSELFTGLLRLLLPELLGSALGSFQLPSIDLSGVAGLPSGTEWTLRDGEVSRFGEYYRFTGSLR